MMIKEAGQRPRLVSLRCLEVWWENGEGHPSKTFDLWTSASPPPPPPPAPQPEALAIDQKNKESLTSSPPRAAACDSCARGPIRLAAWESGLAVNMVSEYEHVQVAGNQQAPTLFIRGTKRNACRRRCSFNRPPSGWRRASEECAPGTTGGLRRGQTPPYQHATGVLAGHAPISRRLAESARPGIDRTGEMTDEPGPQRPDCGRRGRSVNWIKSVCVCVCVVGEHLCSLGFSVMRPIRISMPAVEKFFWINDFHRGQHPWPWGE